MEVLRAGADGGGPRTDNVDFDQRAGIIEFDGGLQRSECRGPGRNPERSPAGRCLGCGDREYAHDPLLLTAPPSRLLGNVLMQRFGRGLGLRPRP